MCITQIIDGEKLLLFQKSKEVERLLLSLESFRNEIHGDDEFYDTEEELFQVAEVFMEVVEGELPLIEKGVNKFVIENVNIWDESNG